MPDSLLAQTLLQNLIFDLDGWESGFENLKTTLARSLRRICIPLRF